jgi:hypothetical protein
VEEQVRERGDVLKLIPKGAGTVPKGIPRSVSDEYRQAIADVLDRAERDWRAGVVVEMYPALLMAHLPRRSKPRDKEVRRRARRFQAGAWEELFAQADRPPPPRSGRSNDALSSLEHEDRRLAKAAGAALNLGSVSKASQLLSNPAATASVTAEEAVAKFTAINPLPGQPAPPLHPHPGEAGQPHPNPDNVEPGTRTRAPLAPTANPHPQPEPLPVRAYLKAARSLDRAKAKGSTGLGNAHLRLMLSRDDGIAASYARYFNALRRGGWDERLRRLLNAGDGLPLMQKGKMRPIVIPSATLRLVGRVAARGIRGDAERFFLHAHPRVRQYAVGVEQGGEMFFRRVCDTLRADPDVLFISSDARSAFNYFDRDSMWALVDDEFPELAAYVRAVYGIESCILLKDSSLGDPVIVLNAVGARQGDPLGTLLYALVAQPILEEVADECPTVEIDAFADDAGFHGDDLPEVVRAYRLYRHLYTSRLKGELNDSKAVAFSFGVTEQAARAAGLPAEMPWANAKLPDGTLRAGGIVLYGAPIGTDAFVRAFLAAAVSDATAAAKRLSYLESNQHKLIMLRMSFCRKLQHIQRLVPTSDHADLLGAYDACLVDAVEDLLVGRGRFTELAATKVHLPAALGGLGIESAAARADACYYSSFTSAYFRLAALDPDWVRWVYRAHELRGHAQFVAQSAAKSRLCATEGMADLLRKLSVHDRPRRAQGKIMNLKHAVEVADLVRTLPPREVTVMQAAANAPHLVSISAGSDPRLRVPNNVLATNLALRLSVTQLPTTPSTGAASETSHKCPGCAQFHVNAHLDGVISCGPAGTALRTHWHDDVARVVHQTAAGIGIPSKLEPASVAADSNIRCDIRLSHASARRGDVYVDVVTYEHTQPDTWDREAFLPGIHCDKEEEKKRDKHFRSVQASDSRNEFVPFAINEYGGVGPQAEEFIDSLVSLGPDRVARKTHLMRRIAAVTAEHVHRQLHGRTKGHAVVRPTVVRAADDGGDDGVVTAGDLAEQTENADDAMAMEDGLGGGLGAAGGGMRRGEDNAKTVAERGGGAAAAGAGVVGQSGGEDGSPVATAGGAAAASVVAVVGDGEGGDGGDAMLVAGGAGARLGGRAERGVCAGCAGGPVGGVCGRCGQGGESGLGASGRAVTL